MSLVMKTKNDLDLLKKHLEEYKPFKVYFDGEGPEIWLYDENDGYYHQKDTGWYRLSISDMLRAIVDDEYFIKLEIYEGE